MDFAFPVNHRVKLDLARELKKLRNMKVTVIRIILGALGTVSTWINTGTGRLGNKRTSGDYPNNSIDKLGKNTEKGPGDLRRLAVTQANKRKTLK